MSIKDYLLENPIDRTQQNPYDQAALNLGVDKEVVRRVWRTLRKQGHVEQKGANPLYKQKEVTVENSFKASGNFAETTRYTHERVVTLEDLIQVCEIDINAWEITNWECNKWEVGARSNEGKIVVSPLFQVKAKLKARKLDTDLALQKDVILDEIRKHSPVRETTLIEGIKGKHLLEIAIPDLHIGKLAWSEEVGEDYDIKIAIKRYKESIETLLSRVDTSIVERILLPVGNDMINIDNNSNTTTSGTPQSADSRFGKMFLAAKNLLIETIDKLSLIAPVDVVVVAGNHDNLSMFTLGEVLSAWYHNSGNVTIDNSPKQRKYYHYGNTGIQFTHGNHEKHLELGLIFATEEPKLWGNTKFRFCQLGHFHHTKKTHYISVEEHQGFQVQVIPSLSGTDAWHYSKGYNALKQAKGFLIHEKDGLIGEYTHSIYINK